MYGISHEKIKKKCSFLTFVILLKQVLKQYIEKKELENEENLSMWNAESILEVYSET
jgi:hypothetical protein